MLEKFFLNLPVGEACESRACHHGPKRALHAHNMAASDWCMGGGGRCPAVRRSVHQQALWVCFLGGFVASDIPDLFWTFQTRCSSARRPEITAPGRAATYLCKRSFTI